MKDIEKVKEEDILKLTKNLKYLNELWVKNLIII